MADSPRKVLENGAQVLQALLGQRGFSFLFIQEAIGSGGAFARGEFRKGNRPMISLKETERFSPEPRKTKLRQQPESNQREWQDVSETLNSAPRRENYSTANVITMSSSPGGVTLRRALNKCRAKDARNCCESGRPYTGARRRRPVTSDLIQVGTPSLPINSSKKLCLGSKSRTSTYSGAIWVTQVSGQERCLRRRILLA